MLVRVLKRMVVVVGLRTDVILSERKWYVENYGTGSCLVIDMLASHVHH